MRAPQVVEGIETHLGYPAHFIALLGAWKLMGGIAIVIPRFPLLKKWAYAGMIFDLTGASVAHLASGDDVRHIVMPLVMCGLVAASWALRPESRKLTLSRR
jgi:DoxX-like family